MKIEKDLKFLLIIILFTVFNAQAQTTFQLNWEEPITYGLEGNFSNRTFFFESAKYNFSESKLPIFNVEIKQAAGRRLKSASIENYTSEQLSSEELEIVEDKQAIPALSLAVENAIIQKKNHAYIKVKPIFKSPNGSIHKLLSFEVNLEYEAGRNRSKSGKSMNFASNSKLANGDWYKVAVMKEGLFKLKYDFLKDLGVDVDNIDPRRLKVFGYGGGALPEANDEPRPDDLLENPILAVGENDGSFDKEDYFVFYGDDQVEWVYDSSQNRFDHKLNPYSDTTFYFIGITAGPGLRVSQQTIPTSPPNQFSQSYDHLVHHEEDLVNLIKSGREWVGEVFDNQLTYSFNWDIPNMVLSEPALAEIHVVARAGKTSTFSIRAENSTYSTAAGATVLDRYAAGYAKPSRKTFQFPLVNNPMNLSITYNKPQAVAKAWLNYVDVNVRRSLVQFGNAMSFRDSRTVAQGSITEFTLVSNKDLRVWNISDPASIQSMNLQRNGNSYTFRDETSNLNEYISFTAFDSTSIIPIGEVENQNLHALAQTDMVIVSHPKFMSQAAELAELRREEGLKVHLVSINQVYNEFSSGSQDIIAIRSFMKMFYDRATVAADMPRYLLLFGDGSYDLKNRVNGNTNFIVGYQSPNYLQPVFSYVSDDFLALLDDHEGTWPNTTSNPEMLDIAVGRFPVKRVDEANGLVTKMRAYNAQNTLADWRNKVVFVGDDEDGVTHMSQADQLANYLDRNHQDMEVQKVFLDAYKQETTSGGERYPEANQAINRAVQNGALILNYTGHGGEAGWAEERILSVDEITSWDKMTNMPIFMTATCEFSRYDDPFRTSAGELVLLNQQGGGAALMSTTRLVYSSPNFALNFDFYEAVFKRNNDGNFKRLGDVFMRTKNDNAGSSNARNFSLLGDPSMKIAIPQHETVTTHLNGKPIAQSDTLKALSKITISGYVTDYQGNKLNGFNGTIYPTVFDKERTVKVLNNDGGSNNWDFEQRDSRIFKGRASVTNGDFSFTFIVPKDIVYDFGRGRITYYFENGQEDGNGFSQNIIVGGSNDSAFTDQQGPEIELFLNDESFVYGGITDSKPVLIANLYDDLGVNTAGSGIGHDLVAEIDGDSKNTFVLNDYYQAKTDNYQEGVIRFPMEGLSEGKHTLRLKAWDVANNSSEKTIEFTVTEDKEIEIQNLVNYPNPFTTNTEFIFQHNQAGVPLDIKLEVFTVSGKLVKSIDRVVVNEGYMSRDIRWDGRDDFGDRIGKGVYIYKLKVRSGNGSVAEKFEKLVIL
ncbi:MAG: type IX secretion system sortase PorU [Vicingaceae bacterium]